MTQIMGLNIVSLAWGVLVASVGFGWESYNDRDNLNISSTEDLLIAVILSSLALVFLTLSVTIYTMNVREMNYLSGNVFFLQFILLSVSVAFLWNICPKKSDDKLDTDNHVFYSAVLVSISLFLLLVHYLYELEPYIAEHNKRIKLRK